MNEYMKLAKELAKENLKTNAGGPFGACIVKNGKIIGKGSNNVLLNNWTLMAKSSWPLKVISYPKTTFGYLEDLYYS